MAAAEGTILAQKLKEAGIPAVVDWKSCSGQGAPDTKRRRREFSGTAEDG